MKKILKKNQGITLIALIITIAILIIISVVSISAFSDSGIITKAKATSFKSEMSSVKENLELNKLNMQMLNTDINVTEEMLASGALKNVSLNDFKEFDSQLKFEIIYWGKYDLGISKISKNYVKNNLESICNDLISTENVPNLYYIASSQITSKTEISYLYDANVNIIYKIKSTSIGTNKVHSIEELEYVGTGENIKERENLLVKINLVNEIVDVNGLKCYSPDLNGLVKSNVKVIYYEITEEEGNKTLTGNSVELPITEYLETKSITSKEYPNYEFYDYNNNMWANIKVENNGVISYWVWIPRYAYKIDGTSTEIKFIDLDNTDLTTGELLDTVEYIVHPSFNQIDENGNDVKLTGIWVSKYESSTIADTVTTEEFYIPDLSGLNKDNTYIEVYDKENNSFIETKLADINNINEFASKNNWYDYENKVWANIKVVADGVESWWVWIPRYAYSITGTVTSIKFVDLNGKPLDGSTLDTTYIEHPAFTQTDENGNTIKLKGIWVSKYESSTK